MGLEIIISGQHTCGNQLLLEYGHEIEKILRRIVADVVNRIRRQWKSVLPVLLFGSVLHYPHYAFDYIVNVSKVPLTMAVVENLYGLALTQLVGEAEIGHIGPSGGAVHRKETEPG